MPPRLSHGLGAGSLLLSALLYGVQPAVARPVDAGPPTAIYVVKPGDTLIDLAALYLDRPDRYRTLQSLNHVANPRRLIPGSRLRIPRRMMRSEAVTGRILAFRGMVQVARAKAEKQAIEGMAIAEGDLVHTGPAAFATIATADGSHISIPSNSAVRITTMRRYLLNGASVFDVRLEQGRLDSVVTPEHSGKRTFRFNTPTAVSAVRGTHLRVSYDSATQRSATEVVEGKVAVNPVGSAAVLILDGRGIIVENRRAGRVEALLPPPSLTDPGKVQKQDNVVFALVTQEGAARYHVQLARDAGFSDLVGEVTASQPRVSFAEVADGNYFVRVSAQAANGLEGMPETFGVRRRQSWVEGQAVDDGKGFLFRWTGRSGGQGTYHLQIFANPAETPLVDETGLGDIGIRLTDLAPGTYFWRVGARQLLGRSVGETWTELEKITVAPPK